MNETIKLMKNHRSIRKFLEKPIEEEILKEIIDCGQHTSTSSFIQAYSVIRITDKKLREEIYKLCGEQPYILEAAEFLVFCPDLNKLKIACEMNNKEMKEGFTESFIIATIDTALISQNIILAAESLGLGGVYIGGVRNNPDKISQLLNLPKNVYPAFGMCLGYPNQNPDVKPRLPMSLVLKENTYSVDENELKEYDETINKYYIERTDG